MDTQSSPSGGNQPKKHAPKSRIQVALRRKKIIKACLDGKSFRQAGIDAGLSPKTVDSQVSEIMKSPEARESFVRILRERGLDDNFLAEKLKALTNAHTSTYAQLDGSFTDERSQPAWETQRKTVELICKLGGYLQPDKSGDDINIGLMQVVVQTLQRQS